MGASALYLMAALDRSDRGWIISHRVPKWEWISELSFWQCRVTFTPSGESITLKGHMGIVRSFDRRRESRWTANLEVMVWGVDIKGERFLQDAYARDISLSGALLTGLDADLRSGDVIGILYGKKKARYRVVWIRYDEAGEKMQVAVHRMDGDECPWRDLLSGEESSQESQPPMQLPRE